MYRYRDSDTPAKRERLHARTVDPARGGHPFVGRAEIRFGASPSLAGARPAIILAPSPGPLFWDFFRTLLDSDHTHRKSAEKSLGAADRVSAPRASAPCKGDDAVFPRQ